MISVSGKVIIITGGAQGIGKAYALELAKSGAKIVLADISPKVAETASEINSSGGDCIGIKTDVSIEEDTKKMAEETINRYGRIDALVNNAAFFANIQRKPFYELSTDEWDRLMAVNLRGMFLCCKAVFPRMKSQGNGKIINISSGTFFRGAPYFLHYVTSKGGVVGFTRALSRELGQYNITVNAIAPGFTATEAALGIDPNPDYTRSILSQRALKREEVPEDLTGTMVYLCSEASDFVTGQTIAVNGGDHLH